MSAEQLRAQKPFSTDPERLEREARLVEGVTTLWSHSKDEWRDAARRVKPDMTDVEFEEMWQHFLLEKDRYANYSS